MALFSASNVCLSMVMMVAVLQMAVVPTPVQADVEVWNNSTTSIAVHDVNTSLSLDPLKAGTQTIFPISDAGEHTFIIDKYVNGTGEQSSLAILQVFPNATLTVFDGNKTSVRTKTVPLGVLVEYLK